MAAAKYDAQRYKMHPSSEYEVPMPFVKKRKTKNLSRNSSNPSLHRKIPLSLDRFHLVSHAVLPKITDTKLLPKQQSYNDDIPQFNTIDHHSSFSSNLFNHNQQSPMSQAKKVLVDMHNEESKLKNRVNYMERE